MSEKACHVEWVPIPNQRCFTRETMRRPARFNSLAQGPTDDPDGDGRNNLAEGRASTHPLDNASAMRISAITLTPTGQVMLRFPLVPGFGHGADSSSDLQTWQTIAAPVFTEPQTGLADWLDDGTLTGGVAALAPSVRVEGAGRGRPLRICGRAAFSGGPAPAVGRHGQNAQTEQGLGKLQAQPLALCEPGRQ